MRKIQYPKNINIYVKTTEACQLKCRHCYLGQEHPNIEFNPDKVADWLVKFKNETNCNITACIHGGEPLLVDATRINSFMDKVSSQIDILWSTCTNLVYPMTKERLDLLVKINNIAPSWDTDYDIKRFGTPKQYSQWEQNLEELNKHIETSVIVSLSNGIIQNYTPKEFNDLIASFGCKYLMLERLMKASEIQAKEIIPTNNDVNQWCYELFLDYIERACYEQCSNIIFDSILAAYVIGGHPSTYSRNCAQSILTLNADGTIAGCPTNHTLIYGTLDDAIPDLFKSRGRAKLAAIESTFNPICYSCDVFDMCGGGCVLLEWQKDSCLGLPKVLRQVRTNLDRDKTLYKNIIARNKYINSY